MNRTHDFRLIKEIYDQCNGDIDKVKQIYKSKYKKHIIGRQIMKALSGLYLQPKEKLDAALYEKELESIDCVVKEEHEIIDDEDPIADGENEEQDQKYEARQNQTTFKINLAACPIVYTTRLEEMHIFKKDLNKIPSSTVVKQVVAESKPQIVMDPLVKREIFDNNSLSFDELVNKIEQFNVLANTQTAKNVLETNYTSYIKTKPDDSLSSQLKFKIQKQCKPAYVLIFNCKSILKLRQCAIHEKYSLGNEVMKCENCVKTYKGNSKLRFVRKKKELTSCTIPFQRIHKLAINFINLWVVLKNFHLNMTEIYHIKNDLGNIPTDYYQIDHIVSEDKELTFYITNDDKLFEFYNCCWYKRHQNLHKIWPTYYANRAPYFWMSTHPCPFNKCTCCCNKGSNVNNQSIISETRTSHQPEVPSNSIYSDWLQCLSTADKSNVGGWINKALNYHRQTKPKLLAEKSIEKKSISPFDVYIKAPSYEQFYILGSDAIVQSYFKLLSSNRLPQIYDTLILNQITKSHEAKVCCWVRRQIFLTNFLPNMPCDVINFFKSPHQCPVGVCKCCCKNKQSLLNIGTKAIEAPQTLSHTNKSTTTLKECLKEVNVKLQENSEERCQIQCKRYRKAKQLIHSERRRGRPPIEVVPVALSQTVQTKSNQQSTSIPADVSIPVNTLEVPSPVANETDDPTVHTLIATILDRFKNIRLSLNPDGKVMAELDTPVTELSNDEVKILSNILTHAQEQVKSLGIIKNPNTLLTNPQQLFPGLVNPAQVDIEVNTPIPDIAVHENLPTNIPKNPLADPFPTNPPNLMTLDGTNQNFLSEFLRNIPKNDMNDARKQLLETVNLSSDLYDAYTKITYVKNKQYHRSLEAYSKQTEGFCSVPKIQNTFSLNPEHTKFNKTTSPREESKLTGKRKSENDSILEGVLTTKKIKKPPKIKIRNFQSQTKTERPASRESPSSTVTQQGVPPLHLYNTPYNLPILMGSQYLPHQLPNSAAMNNLLVRPVLTPNAVDTLPEISHVDDDCILGV